MKIYKYSYPINKKCDLHIPIGNQYCIFDCPHNVNNRMVDINNYELKCNYNSKDSNDSNHKHTN